MTRHPEGRSLWSHADFRLLWAAATLSILGTETVAVVMPLIAVTVLDAGPLAVSSLTFLALAPFLVLGLPAGVWVERRPRRPVLVACELARAAALASIPAAWAWGALTLAHMYAVVVAVGVGRLLFDVAHTSYLPRLVDRARLVEGNTKLYVSYAGGQVAGPSLAGAMLTVTAAPLAIVADVAAFLASAHLLTRVRAAEPPRAPFDGERGARAYARDVGEGVRWIFGHPLLRPTIACAGVYSFGEAGIVSLFSLYAVRRLGLAPDEVAGVLAAGALGFPAGALAARRAFAALGVGRAAIAAAAVSCAGMLVVPLAPEARPVPVLVAAWFAVWIGPSVFGIASVSLRQALTPDRLQARQHATARVVVWGAMSLGALCAGVVGEVVGVRVALVAMGVVATSCLVPLLSSRPFRTLRDVPAAGGAPADDAPAAEVTAG